MKAFCTIATASPYYYHAAWNLAMSMKKHGSEIPFILICDGGDNWAHIRQRDRNIFDRVIFLKGDDTTPLYSKTRVYDYIPEEFNEFIFIDADSLCLKNPDDLFEKMPDFGPMTEGFGKYGDHKIETAWVKPIERIWDYYGFDKKRVFSEINSSIMRVKRSPTAEAIFKLAENYYAADFYAAASRLGGHYPDELAFETAMLAIGYTPPEFRPLFIHYANDKKTPQTRLKTWKQYFLSLPGNRNHVSGYTWEEYRNHVIKWSREMGLGEGYRFIPQMKAANQKVQYNGLRPNDSPEWVEELIATFAKPKRRKPKKKEEEL